MIHSFFRNALDAIKSALGIRLPSRVWIDELRCKREHVELVKWIARIDAAIVDLRELVEA
jgi:hypothetical protein